MHRATRGGPLRFPAATILPLVILVALVGCDDSVTEPEPDAATDIEEVISSLAAEGVTATLRSGSPGSDDSAPAASVSGFPTVIPGGGARYTVEAPQEFSVVYLFIEGREGYYELDLGSTHAFGESTAGSARTAVDLVLTLGEGLEDDGYRLGFAVGTGAGAGPAESWDVEVVDVGTGDVQISVAWDVPSDVDLYVVEPSGETIWYGNRTSATGGELDLDSNAGCGGQDVRNENITWPEVTPPNGEYVVRVNYWSDCGQVATNYVVTVRVAGQPTRTFEGQFTGDGVGGGRDAGEVIATFTY